MAKNLVIVESPAKAKTIERYLGSSYQVASSNGHIRDLIKGNNAINIEQGFLPSYEISPGKERVVQQLKKLAHNSDCVYLASDDDREGESISWHLKEALELKDDKVQRIVFREITKMAVLNALKQPRTIDLDLVDSQQARRVLDRLVGYDLSPLLWKKIKPGLSAGRVQSVAVRMVVERERAIDRFVTTAHFAVSAFFSLPTGQVLKADSPEKFKTEAEAFTFLEKCKGALFSIKALDTKALKRSPSPPFITSTLQQEASRKLGYSVNRTMALAQQLYETGKISYMRTDSVNLSKEAIQNISEMVSTTYGAAYFQARSYTTKSSTAQEAHEAIRPTDFSVKVASSHKDEQRLYELIWRRAMAAHMADAQIEKTIATIQISTTDQPLIATGEVLKFEGFLKAYARDQVDEEGSDETKGMLPPLHIGQALCLEKMWARERFTNPPARYTEATLVRDLEEREIGRPSTYAPIIATIQKRGYIKLESREGFPRAYKLLTLQNNHIQTETLTEIVRAEKQKLFPTDMAAVVNDFLVQHFSDVTDYNFTAQVEKELDKIAQGAKIWNQMLSEFYSGFYPKVQATAGIERSTVSYTRRLGKDPATNASLIVRLGKYGPLVQLGVEEDGREEAPRFAGLRANQRMETITLEEALELFKLPRTVGTFETLPLLINIGRFGPYIKHGTLFYSIPKAEDPFTIHEQDAIAIIEAKRKADAEKLIKAFPEDPAIQILHGRWGPYIKNGKNHTRIPKDIADPALLSLAECLHILANNLKSKSVKKAP
ncbi:DNA topoisomerase I [Cardinium endosymbiont of Sogatella furcifera]|uniref:type I DNA topoisomerase n=1 Tax=Cardinium endosymbiont of Sogatella furcifera TaxID=650378 RepID=UPI000E0DA981|nr:type I DNA topoisomerase [Cardinium endosymbiont of Sogatella furcifera]AXI24317.1 DNA topoisomerase I [Cardinium endosymbiont of Sogatella furcifera]